MDHGPCRTPPPVDAAVVHRGRRAHHRQRRVRHDRHLPVPRFPRRRTNARFLWIAFLLLPLALVCDVLDGYVARLNRSRQSVLGADLDSLADVISFGVAPAVLGFTLGLRGGWDMLILTYFVVCGVSRLARFNVTAVGAGRRGHRQGEVLRGHAHPHQHRLVVLLGRRSPGPDTSRTGPVVRGAVGSARPTLHPLSLRLRPERQRDDQRHAPYPETLMPARPFPPRHLAS